VGDGQPPDGRFAYLLLKHPRRPASQSRPRKGIEKISRNAPDLFSLPGGKTNTPSAAILFWINRKAAFREAPSV
jgi:hypothetical protein